MFIYNNVYRCHVTDIRFYSPCTYAPHVPCASNDAARKNRPTPSFVYARKEFSDFLLKKYERVPAGTIDDMRKKMNV